MTKEYLESILTEYGVAFTDSLADRLLTNYKDAYNKGWDDGAKATYEHLKMCEEETSGDLINRDELLKTIDTWDKFGCDADTKLVPYQDHYVPYIHYDDVVNCIKGMSPVNPQPICEEREKGECPYYAG